MPSRSAMVAVVVVLTILAGIAVAEPLTTAFTYQGEINQSGTPLTGTADFQFSLYDALSGGAQVGSTLSINNVTVSNGIFAALLDFGVNVFTGEARYLEIALRAPAGGGAFTTLSPRVTVTPTPYSLQTRGIFVDSNENVRIGSPTPPLGTATVSQITGPPAEKLKVYAHGPGDVAVDAEATSTTGTSDGMRGKSASSEGRGVVGEATAGIGDTKGVHGKNSSIAGAGVFGESDSPEGIASGVHGKSMANGAGVLGEAIGGVGVHGKSHETGVFGEADSGTGPTQGMHGISHSDEGTGVFGEAVVPTGATKGMHGKSASSNGVGVMGEANATTGDAKGMHGKSDSDQGTGVYGEAAAASGATKGMHGKSASSNGVGVMGEANATTGDAKGMHGKSDSDQGTGVYGEAAAPSGATKGMHGKSASSSGVGVMGEAAAAAGSTVGVGGLSASSGGIGVTGEVTAMTGTTKGMYGKSASPAGVGVMGEATAMSGSTKGMYGKSASSSGVGVMGEANATTGSTVGVLGVANATGVSGWGMGSGTSFGVEGHIGADAGAGVVGVADYRVNGNAAGLEGYSGAPGGAGLRVRGQSGADAIEIQYGGISVSAGGLVPFVKTTIAAAWTAIASCSGGGPSHTHTVGHYADVQLNNPLIGAGSILLITVAGPGGPTTVAYSASVISKSSQTAQVRISAVNIGGPCSPPPSNVTLDYVIVNIK